MEPPGRKGSMGKNLGGNGQAVLTGRPAVWPLIRDEGERKGGECGGSPQATGNGVKPAPQGGKVCAASLIRNDMRYTNPILIYGSIVSSVGFWLLAFDRAGAMQLVIDSFITGVGVVSLLIPIVNMIAVSMPAENVAVGLGFNTMVRYLGSSIGPVLAAAFMTTYKYYVVDSPSMLNLMFTEAGPVAFKYIFLTALAFSLMTAAVSIFTVNYVPKRR